MAQYIKDKRGKRVKARRVLHIDSIRFFPLIIFYMQERAFIVYTE